MYIDKAILTELSSLNENLIYLTQQNREAGLFFKKPEDNELTVTRSRVAYLSRLVEWYKTKVNEVLSLVAHRTIVSEGDPRFDYHSEKRKIDAKQLAADILGGLQNGFTIDTILPVWVKRLIDRGLLLPEQSAHPDLTAPVDTERLERQRLAAQKEAEYQAGLERLKGAVLTYAKEQNNPWAFEDFRQAYHSGIVGFEHSEKGLLEFSKELGRRNLLPIGDRLLSSLSELWQRLQKAVA